MAVAHVLGQAETSGLPASSRVKASATETGAWAPSPRFSDQRMGIDAHLFGIGGISAIILAILLAAMATWRPRATPSAPATLSVFDLAPPAAPPELVQDSPPGPRKIEKKEEQAVPDKPVADPPIVQLPSPESLPVAAPRPAVDPGPPVEETTAPESRPIPPAPQASTGKPTWEGLVLGALNKVKRYPRDAHFARHQGIPYIRFVMNREGKLLSVRIERSSGFRSLDQEALALPKRAQPLPKPPEEVTGEMIELVVPVEFFIR